MMKSFKVFLSAILALALLSSIFAPLPAFAAPASPTVKVPLFFAAKGAHRGPAWQAVQFVPGQIIVKYKNQGQAQAPPPTAAKLRKIKDLGTTGAQLISVPSDQVAETIASLRASGLVEYATPDYLLHICGAPNDTLFSRQWGLDNTGQTIPDNFSGSLVAGTPDVDINAPKAWSGRESKQQTLVGVMDTGVDINHPDLRGSIWKNPHPGRYGYDGDLNGWNFVDNNGIVFDSSNPLADAHGTHIAGIIAANTGNRQGIAGVAPGIKIVVLKFIGPDGYGTLSNAILAIDYARKIGVRVINASWGGYFPLNTGDPQYDPDLLPLGDAIKSSKILFVASSGNDGLDLDTLPDQGYQCYPAGFRFPNVITVAAVNSRGELCNLQANGWDSNFGSDTVDVAAPGSDIVSAFTMDPSWGGSVEATIYNTHTACWGFGLQDIDGKSNRAELLRRELLFLKQKHGLHDGMNKSGVLLVDDDNSEAGFPDCGRYWTQALDDLRIRYQVVSAPASTSAASGGPSLADMKPFDVVIWQTGRDGESGPLLTVQDKANLSAYVEQGGSLLLTGEKAVAEDPGWAAQLLQAHVIQLGTPDQPAPLPFYNLSGQPGSSCEGFNCIADGADFNSLPVSFDLLIPANQDTARSGLTYRYAFLDGTSMSAPYVSAVGALLFGKYPRLSAEEARQTIMVSAKPLDSLRGKVGAGGMVDAGAALGFARQK